MGVIGASEDGSYVYFGRTEPCRPASAKATAIFGSP